MEGLLGVKFFSQICTMTTVETLHINIYPIQTEDIPNIDESNSDGKFQMDSGFVCTQSILENDKCHSGDVSNFQSDNTLICRYTSMCISACIIYIQLESI